MISPVGCTEPAIDLEPATLDDFPELPASVAADGTFVAVRRIMVGGAPLGRVLIRWDSETLEPSVGPILDARGPIDLVGDGPRLIIADHPHVVVADGATGQTLVTTTPRVIARIDRPIEHVASDTVGGAVLSLRHGHDFIVVQRFLNEDSGLRPFDIYIAPIGEHTPEPIETSPLLRYVAVALYDRWSMWETPSWVVLDVDAQRIIPLDGYQPIGWTSRERLVAWIHEGGMLGRTNTIALLELRAQPPVVLLSIDTNSWSGFAGIAGDSLIFANVGVWHRLDLTTQTTSSFDVSADSCQRPLVSPDQEFIAGCAEDLQFQPLPNTQAPAREVDGAQ